MIPAAAAGAAASSLLPGFDFSGALGGTFGAGAFGDSGHMSNQSGAISQDFNGGTINIMPNGASGYTVYAILAVIVVLAFLWFKGGK